MSVMINLLPDVRLQKIRDAQRKRLMTASSISVIGGSLVILALLFIFEQAQNLQINSLTNKIASKSQQLTSQPDITKILTMEKQLSNLPGLYDRRRGSDQVIRDLQAVTPQTVSISSYQLGVDGTISISGTGRSYAAVTQFIKALKESGRTLDSGESRIVDIGIAYGTADLGPLASTTGTLTTFTLTGKLAEGTK